MFGVVKPCDAGGEMEMKVNEEPGKTQLLTHNEPMLMSSEFLWRMKCTSEGFKVGECHDQNYILERSLWMLCGDLGLFPWIYVVLWGIYLISSEIQLR